MNNKKICFITCVNNERQYQECLMYINSLSIPEGYEIDAVSINEAESMASGYNAAMRETDAKYKVYLHQDVFIINKYFIYDILNIFNKDKSIGMIGAIGAKALPVSGIWLESSQKYGQVYSKKNGEMQLLSFKKTVDEYTTVKSIDGLIMITQYDITWKEEIFNGWYFYDASQSYEFNLAGFKVVVPEQKEAWCIHDCASENVKDQYEFYRNVFLNQYLQDIFPLVSVLMPTCDNPEYFTLALESVLNQTYKNIEIIIGDFSTSDNTEKLLMDRYIKKNNNIIYFHDKNSMNQINNNKKLLEIAQGKYVNYLIDYDIFEPNRIEKMINYFIQDNNEEISLITSHITAIDNDGNAGDIISKTNEIIKEDTITDGVGFGNLILKNNLNFILEPTAILFRKKTLMKQLEACKEREYGYVLTLNGMLNILSSGKAVFINDILSYISIKNIEKFSSDCFKLLYTLDYANEVLKSKESGFLIKNQDFRIALLSCENHCKNIINYFDSFKIKDCYCEKYELFKKLYENIDKNLVNCPKSCTSDDDGENGELPLVSILIPAYNQTIYLKEALESAINQTYPNIEIIIGDDSTTNEVENFIQPYLKRYSNIVYFKNEREGMDYGYKNHLQCLLRSRGEYVNYLNHDDVFHEEKIEKMMKYFWENPNVTLVTSVRQPIDEEGKRLSLGGPFNRLFSKDTIISGQKMCKYVATNLLNYIGEPSTVLFKKRYLNEGVYGYFNNVKFWGIADVANWFSLLQYGDLVYISDALSYFRVHPDQSTNMSKVFIKGSLAWFYLIENSYKKGIINGMEYKKVLSKYFGSMLVSLNNYVLDKPDVEMDLKEEIVEVNNKVINEIIYKEIENNCECNVCGNRIERFLPYQYREHSSDFTYKYNVIGSDTENFSCPHCYSHDRERHLVKYFDELKIWDKYIKGKNVLHVAPEKHIQDIVYNLGAREYICGDLYPVNNSIMKMDITNIQFNDNYFDFIICNHVLEHVPDDLKAMKELYRVLKKGSAAVLQTPYSPLIDKSFEDSNINTDELRRKFYGQSDHVRIYGTDLFKRLETAGFKLKIIENSEFFTCEEVKKYGFNSREDLILAFKE